jgi:hypothetical protein
MGAIERVNARPPQLRAELLEKARQCQNLDLDVFVQRVELQLKLIADLNDPAHLLQYGMKDICCQLHIKSWKSHPHRQIRISFGMAKFLGRRRLSGVRTVASNLCTIAATMLADGPDSRLTSIQFFDADPGSLTPEKHHAA